MTSPALAVAARQVPYEPAELPEPGKQSLGQGDAAARAGVAHDPDRDVEHVNTIVPIEHFGATTGPDIRPPGVDRVAFARRISTFRHWDGEDGVNNLGTHVELHGVVAVQPNQGIEAPFAPRRNTYRVPPQPADTGLTYGE